MITDTQFIYQEGDYVVCTGFASAANVFHYTSEA
jgi:hypothetical protein